MAVLKILNGDHRYFNDDAPEKLVQYIMNPNKAISGYVGGTTTIENAAAKMHKTYEMFNKRHGIKVRHFVLSFAPDEVENASDANAIAMMVAIFFVGEYDIFFAVHENRKNLHIHFVMNNVSHLDGHRYKGTRKEFFDFVHHLTDKLSEWDIHDLKYVSACDKF